jgi:hypothetical protein
MKTFPALLALFALTLLTTASVMGQDEGWGTIKGRVVWGGDKVPERRPIDLAGPNAQQCLKMGKPPLSEDWVVDPKTKGIRWTFVWLTAEKGKTLPVRPDLKEIKVKEVSMDQPWCMFEPHALAMRQGQTLLAKNSAAIAHNFRGIGNPAANPGFNLILAPNTTVPIQGLRADRLPIVIQCDIHRWMKAYVRVFDHPYYAVTDENGAFEIKNAPAGEYRLVVWHGTGGWRGGAEGKNGVPISVQADAATELGDLTYVSQTP